MLCINIHNSVKALLLLFQILKWRFPVRDRGHLVSKQRGDVSNHWAGEGVVGSSTTLYKKKSTRERRAGVNEMENTPITTFRETKNPSFETWWFIYKILYIFCIHGEVLYWIRPHDTWFVVPAAGSSNCQPARYVICTWSSQYICITILSRILPCCRPWPMTLSFLTHAEVKTNPSAGGGYRRVQVGRLLNHLFLFSDSCRKLQFHHHCRSAPSSKKKKRPT